MGGTHYYIQSLLFKNSTIVGLDNVSKVRELTADELQLLDATDGSTFAKLKEVDPIVAGKFHPNDTRRIRRALEIYLTTGKRTSELYEEQAKQNGTTPRYNSLTFWIYCDKDVLNARLDARVDDMLRGTLEDELRELYEEYQTLPQPVDLERGIFQVIGFRQFLPWLGGQETSQASGIEQMKVATRRYATRQTKWIQKKLIPMVQDANAKGTQERCEVALLDSTDLAAWHENVGARGVEIAKKFLDGKFPENMAAPPGRESLLAGRSADDSFTPDKWQHFECTKCLLADGRPSVYIGEAAWQEHIRSKRHRAKRSSTPPAWDRTRGQANSDEPKQQ